MNTAVPAVADTESVTGPPRMHVPAGLLSVRELGRVASGGFFLYVFSTIATTLATMVLARAMNLGAFGLYSWVIATVQLLSVPAVLGIDRLLVRDIAVYMGESAYGAVRGLLRRSAELMVATCVVIGGATILVAWLSQGIDTTTATALTIGIVGLPLVAFTRLGQSALMGIHRVVVAQVADLAIRPAVLLIVVVVGAVAMAGRLDAPTAVALYTASAAAGLLAVGYSMWRGLGQSLHPAAPSYETRRWMTAAFGLALLSGGALANGQIGVTLLGVFSTPEAAGLYAVAQRGAVTVAFPLFGLGAALAPTAARLWSAGRFIELQRLVTLGTRGVLLAALPIALVFVVFGGQILSLLFGPGFSAASTSLTLLTLSQVFNAATGSVQTLLIMTGRTRLTALGIAVGLGTNVVLGIWLIPVYHEIGAAIAAAASLLLTNAIHVVMARRFLGIDTTPFGLAVVKP